MAETLSRACSCTVSREAIERGSRLTAAAATAWSATPLATSRAAEEPDDAAKAPGAAADDGRDCFGGGGDAPGAHGACGSVCVVRSHLDRGMG